MLVVIKSKPESEKFTHEQVGYEQPSSHLNERCGNCKHFIPETKDSPAGCEGVQRPIAADAWCHRYDKDSNMKKHKYMRTTIEHHGDGSHTVRHHHMDGEKHDKTHAVGADMGLDGVHDSLQDHLGSPNSGETAADAGMHGVPAEQAAPAGLPMSPAGA